MKESGQIHSSTKEESERCVLDAVPANARRATDTWVKALHAYNSSINSKTCSVEDLAAVLLDGFYFCLKRHLGELYHGFNIYSDKAFEQSSKILNVALKANQRNKNEAAVSHKDAVSDGDWTKIMEHFSDVQTTQDPVHLARCVSVVYCLNLYRSSLFMHELIFVSQPWVLSDTCG